MAFNAALKSVKMLKFAKTEVQLYLIDDGAGEWQDGAMRGQLLGKALHLLTALNFVPSPPTGPT